MLKDLAPQARTPEPTIPHTSPSAHPPLGRAALWIAVGTLTGSLLGLARMSVISAVFGQSAAVGIFFAALKTPQMLSDLLIGGAVSGALIPTLARYAHPTQRAELRRLLIALLALVTVSMAIATVALMLAAPLVVPLLNGGFAPRDQAQATALVRMLALMLLGTGIVAVLSASLYALGRGIFPSLAAGVLHLGVIAATLTLAPRLGITALAVGILLGTAAQVAFLSLCLLPSLRTLRGFSRPSCSRPLLFWRHLSHPALLALWRTYTPIAVGMLVTLALGMVDQRLQSGTYDPATHRSGGPNVAALATATLLIQFPAGLVAAALGYAALPALAGAREQPQMMAAIVRRALGLGLVLILPVMLLYLIGGERIVSLLFGHRAFTGADVARTVLALRGYAPQLPALVVEQVLLAVCYARGQTRQALTTGLLSGGAYLAVALPLTPRLGMPALAVANTALHCTNALLLLGMVGRSLPLFTASSPSAARPPRRRVSRRPVPPPVAG